MSVFLSVVLLGLLGQNAFAAKIGTSKAYSFDGNSYKFAPRIMEAELNATLVCLRYLFEVGAPDNGIPSIATLDIPEITLNVQDLVEDGSGYFTSNGGVAVGLSNFFSPELTTALSVLPLGLEADIVLMFPNLHVDLDYDMDLSVMGMSIYGNGKIVLDLTDVAIRLQGFVALGDALAVTDLVVFLNIGASHVEITGWFNDEEHSQAVTDLVNGYILPHWINAQPQEISDTISPLLQDLLDSSLGGDSENGGDPMDLEAALAAIGEICEEAGIPV